MQAQTLADHDLTSRGVVVLSGALLLAASATEIALVGRLGWFFGACFVLASVTAALVVRPDGFFTVGVLPPLLMLAVLVAVAVVRPEAVVAEGLVETAGAAQRVVAGAVGHATWLLAGHLAVLALVGARLRVELRRAD